MLEGMLSRNPKQHAAWSHWALTRSTTGGRNGKQENHINSFFLSEWGGRAPKVFDCQSPKPTFTEVEICPGMRTDVFISSPAREVTLADTHFCLQTLTHALTHAHTHSQRLDRQIAHLSVQSTRWAPLWAGRQRKPSVVTGNETLGCTWVNTHTHLPTSSAL